ncbi:MULTISPECIES: pentapeptide repeat-containing protein [Actinomadura]|uniref:Pentapeptide repeat-containing protein n=1 Tax=Actinomadura yumaensis TaxID=111807 RepID=A0ABW2CIR4_9ACTN|nr:pentapeptide repeat-containing protein [Actinomadura sp. J1-007]MWK37109.1 pentapeptide repeat-containing protein [Actinomadura sp. J1-007]
MLAAAGAAALAIWVTTAWLLEVADDAKAGTERARVRVDAVRTGLAAGGGAAAAVGLMLAFRRQRHAELATALGELDAAERRITELYNAAAEQLASAKAPVRLAALYTLRRLANSNPGHRQTVVDIICAYLRMPYEPVGASPGPSDSQRRAARRYHATRTTGAAPAEPSSIDLREELQVRLTAQRILHTHLQPDAQAHWQDVSLDLTGATLTDFTLADCRVRDADFSSATFVGAARLTGASFSGIAGFERASFSSSAWFTGASFSGEARFYKASFSADAWFVGTCFSGGAQFSETFFSGGVSFEKASFSRRGVSLTGAADFVWATFSGYAEFSGASFSGPASFNRAAFSRTVALGDTRFEAGVSLDAATVANRNQSHGLPRGWRIEPAEGTTGLLTRETPSGPASGT